MTGATYFGGKKPRAKIANAISTLEYRFSRLNLMVKEHRISIPRSERPNHILFSKSGYVDMFEGYGGVMLQPNHFDDTAFEIPENVLMVDDIWLSGNLEKFWSQNLTHGKVGIFPTPFRR